MIKTTKKCGSNKPVKVGMFVPVRNPDLPTSIDKNSGFVNNETRNGLIEILRELDCVDLTPNVDFRKAVVINGKVLVGDICLNDFDVFLWYAEVDPRPTSYHIEVLETLAHDSVVVNNPSALRVGLDKYLAHTKLRQAGVDVAEFASFPNDAHSYEKILPLLEKWGEVWIKPRLGCFGQGIIKVTDASTLRDIVSYTRLSESGTLTLGGGVRSIFIERFYPNDLEKWCSTTIIGSKLAYGYKKRSEKFVDGKVFDPDEMGGGVDYVNPSPQQRDLALQAAGVLGLDVVGFDIITTVPDGKLVIVDENTFPGFYPNLFKELRSDPAKYFFDCVKKYIDISTEKREVR